ncbi:MAG: flavin reductase [Acidobacteria bacterium]|nr:flavin reductase [Acidobacteriota bacterium]
MTIAFEELRPEDLQMNVFSRIGRDWMLITAGPVEDCNTMTASWGGLGVLWHRNVSFVFVRPVRWTYRFMEKHPVYTLSFFDEEHRGALQLCGSRSGRDTDKIRDAGLTPFPTPENGTGFTQARLVLECRKLHSQDLDPSRFLDPSILGNYPDRDFHRLYIGEILNCLTR